MRRTESHKVRRGTKTGLLLALLIPASAGGFALLTGFGSEKDALSADAEIASAAARSSPKATGEPAPVHDGLSTAHGLPRQGADGGNLLDAPGPGKALDSADVASADSAVAGGSAAASRTMPVEGERSEARTGARRTKTRNEEWKWDTTNLDKLDRWRYGDQEHPNLRGRDFGDAELGFVDLASADLQDASFDGAKLAWADLRSANLKDAVLNATSLYGADLRDADLQGTAMEMVSLFSVDLRGANLRDARLGCQDCNRVSSLINSNLKGADLRGAHFGNSFIDATVFDEADLRGADLAVARGLPRSLRGALYNDSTRWPERIDPREWEMVYVPDGGRSGPGLDGQH